MATRISQSPFTSLSHASAHSSQYSSESLHWWIAKKKKKTLLKILYWDPEKHWIRKLIFYISPAKNSNLKWHSIHKYSYYSYILFGLWQYICCFVKGFLIAFIFKFIVCMCACTCVCLSTYMSVNAKESLLQEPCSWWWH